MKNNNILEDIEKELGIDTLSPVKNIRSSAEELSRIKKFSDENLDLIASKLTTTDEEEKRDIVVNLISALDYYVHEIIIWGIVQITLNKFPKGDKYNSIEISIKHLKEIIENTEEDIFYNSELRETIIEKTKSFTYHEWQRIKEDLRLILPKTIHSRLGELVSGQNSPAVFQVNELENLKNKRNSIVHHFDRDYKNTSQRNTFDIDCQKSFDLIKNIIDSIHNIILNYDNTHPEE